MKEFKLPYGLKGSELFSIDEVDSGLSCNCVCPACEQKLIAKKGNVKNHHFAHYKTNDCLGGLETALHRICKEIIYNSQTFTTPAVCYPGTPFEIVEERKIPVDSVKIEKHIGSIIPDIVIESKGKKLLVEIIVTNAINENKKNWIQKENVAVIVIYAKHLLNKLYLKRDFRLHDADFQNEIVNGTKYKLWLHNPKIEETKAKLKKRYTLKKQVKFFETDSGKYYFVEHCPLEKRFWKKGKNKGKPFASVYDDCNTCSFHFSMDNNNSFKIPEALYCIGHIKSKFMQVLAQLNKW
jgi:competence CoiA-like predicted nuclease